MKLILRKAKESDLTDIIAMLADDELGSKRENFTHPLPEIYVEAFKIIDSDPFQNLMVVVEESKIIGTYQLSFIQYLTYQGGLRAQIEAVRIHKDHRGKGLGEWVFKKAITTARERGAHVLQLTTDKKRPDAIKFYKKLGFKDSHEGMKIHL